MIWLVEIGLVFYIQAQKHEESNHCDCRTCRCVCIIKWCHFIRDVINVYRGNSGRRIFMQQLPWRAMSLVGVFNEERPISSWSCRL